MTDVRANFVSATGSFVAQVSAIGAGPLTGPGLGDWDLRALVGHASRSLITVETYLDRPADALRVPNAAAYYRLVLEVGGARQSGVAERGREAGAALGDTPADAVAELATRAFDKLSTYGDDYLLETAAGAMCLGDYLRTRTFELVVHGLDIATATGVDPAFDEGPLIDAATLAAEVAVVIGSGPVLLLSLTGRRSLPEGFSIV